MTSAPSVADIGFSGIPIANRISADQPVASAIGIRGTSARCGWRKTTSSTSADGDQPSQQHQHPMRGRGQRRVGLRRQHRDAGQLRRHAGGGCSCERM